MYKCNKCLREFFNYCSQHGIFEIVEGKFIISTCQGLCVFYPDVETNHDEKDCICRR